MALRLVNTAPGEVTTAIKPEQPIHMGMKSETLSVQLASTNVDVGLSRVANVGVLPEEDDGLLKAGASLSIQTSERRLPVTGQASTAIVGSSLLVTKNSNSLGEQSVYEITVPVEPQNSVLAYFKLRTKAAWGVVSPDWCNLPNLIGMYFGVEHSAFNTAAYAFLRNDGSSGSIVFAGPLQSLGGTRFGQTQLATDLDPATGGTQGWMSLGNNAVLEIFIRINTYVQPYRAELWTRIAATPAPIFQGSILLSNLGQFPGASFSNGRQGPTNSATIFFGNLGQAGDVLQLDDWALFPDYRAAIINGQATANVERRLTPDSPMTYDISSKKKMEDLDVGRWFPATEMGTVAPTSSLFYQPGVYSKPAHLSMKKDDSGVKLFQRKEPRLEQRVDGFMMEAVLSGVSTSRNFDLVGPGFSVSDGQKEFRISMLETASSRNFGIYSSGPTTSEDSYIKPQSDTDFRSPKLVRLTMDRHRSKLSLSIDEEKVIDEGMDTYPVLLSEPVILPASDILGEQIVFEISLDGGSSWGTFPPIPFYGSAVFLGDIVDILNNNGDFSGEGLVAYEYGNRLAIESPHMGSQSGLRINLGLSSAVGNTGSLLRFPTSTSFGNTVTLPNSPVGGRFAVGHPIQDATNSELKLSYVRYLTRYLAWESEDGLLPTQSPQFATLFAVDSLGAGTAAMESDRLVITKPDFSNTPARHVFRKNQSLNSVSGIQVDFDFDVESYTNNVGQTNAPNIAVGAGVTIYLGDKRVCFNVYDCGMSGRKVGILSGTGTEQDIINQTALGLRTSAFVDWTRPNKYRISVRAFQAIEVWSGSVIDAPIISIPWRDDLNGFDLPLDNSPAGVAFGHFGFLTYSSSSKTNWRYFRWGFSNGYEMAIQQKYPNGVPKYAFGGKAFILSTFDEA